MAKGVALPGRYRAHPRKCTHRLGSPFPWNPGRHLASATHSSSCSVAFTSRASPRHVAPRGPIWLVLSLLDRTNDMAV